jgi:hypothetical protein
MISPRIMKSFEYEIPAAIPILVIAAGNASSKHARSPVATENAGMRASQPGLLGVMILLEPPFDFLR